MTSIIHDFRSIRRKLERQEQKAEFEEKNPKEEPAMYGMGWPYTVAVPLVASSSPSELNDYCRAQFIKVWGGKI